MMNRVSSRNSKPSPRYLFTCINKCAVTVGSPSLQVFKRDGRQKNGAGNRNNAVRIRETEIDPTQVNAITCSKRAKDLISVCIKNGDSLKYKEYTKATSVTVA
jgi:hypothetical protein